MGRTSRAYNDALSFLKCDSLDEVTASLTRIMDAWSVPAHVHRIIRPNLISVVPRVITNYPTAWIDRYRENRYEVFDAVIEHAGRSHVPLTRLALTGSRNISSVQRRIFGEFAEVGFHSGAFFPLHGPDDNLAVFSIAFSCSGAEFERYWRENCVGLSFVVSAAHEALVACDRKLPRKMVPLNLSARETECLLWASRGKTRHETGDILDVGDETVSSHIKSAMRKMGVHTKPHAVAKAVRMGLIIP